MTHDPWPSPIYDTVPSVIVLLVFLVALFYGTLFLATGRRCLAAGYPQGAITYNLERYCVKRVDQTEVVVPLERAEGQKP